MPEPRLSVLVVARDEAHNLADCLAAAAWADERVVVVDAASRDATLAIARREADVVAVRAFDDFASQRNAALAMATGDWVLSVDADERITPELAAEVRRVIADRDAPYRGYRVPIRSEILGRPFAFSGTQHDHPLRLFRRDSGRWVGLVHETVDLEGPAGSVRGELRHRTIPTMSAFLHKIDRYTTLEAEGLAGARQALAARRPGRAPRLDVLQALRAQAGIPRRRRGVHVLPVLGRVGRRAGLEAPRADHDAEGHMIAHEASVAARFDALHARFKPEVADDDPRVLGIIASLGPLRRPSRPRPGMRQGAVCPVLAARGARVVGLDVSAAMLAAAEDTGFDRVRGSARRLPFRAGELRRRDRGRGLRAPRAPRRSTTPATRCGECSGREACSCSSTRTCRR